MELIFTPAVVALCTNVSIVNDSVLESTEQFSVELSTTDFDVMLANGSATVTIFDDDRKYSSSKSWYSHVITLSLLLPRPGVRIGWRQLVYELGEEDGFLTVCAVLFGLTARNVSVSASTTDSRDAEGMVIQVFVTTGGVIIFPYFYSRKRL